MERKEVYAVIKENNLQDVIKQYFGKNYTNISTDKLNTFIAQALPATTNDVEVVECPFVSGLSKLVEVLSNKRILLKSEVDYILND